MTYSVAVVLAVIVAFEVTYALRTAVPAERPRPASDAGARTWWRAGPLESACVSGASPADILSIVRQVGVEPKVTEHRTLTGELTSVEVETPPDHDDPATSIIFYRDQGTCDAARAPNQPIPQDYR